MGCCMKISRTLTLLVRAIGLARVRARSHSYDHFDAHDGVRILGAFWRQRVRECTSQPLVN